MATPKVEFYAAAAAPHAMLELARKALGHAQVAWLMRLPRGCRASEHLGLQLRDAAADLYPRCTVARLTREDCVLWVGVRPAGNPAPLTPKRPRLSPADCSAPCRN